MNEDLKRLKALAGIQMVSESAPPGMEDVVLDLKKQYPGEPDKAFATAWSIYNQKHGRVQESDDVIKDTMDEDGDDEISESLDDDEATRWATDLFKSAGVALPHQTRVKPEFKKVSGRRPKPAPDTIAGDDEGYITLKARGELLDQLIPLAKERDHLIYRAERWGPLPPAVRADIDDSHYNTRDIEGKIEKARSGIEILKQYINTKRNLYGKKRVMEDGYSGDAQLDAEIDRLLQNASDGFVEKDDALMRVAYYLLDSGLDNSQVEQIMTAVESKLGAADTADADHDLDEARLPDRINAEQVNQLASLPLDAARQRAEEIIVNTSTRDDKKQYLLDQLARARNTMGIIKLLYDMILAGEGHRVVGKNTYAQRFKESGLSEAEIAQLNYSDASRLAQRIEDEKWRRLSQQPDSDVQPLPAKTWRDILAANDEKRGIDAVTTEDLNNGYSSEEYLDGEDYFPDGATTSVTGAVGPRGAAQGDNPMQKATAADLNETYNRLMASYQRHLSK